MDTFYEILLDFWYTVGAPEINYYINTFLYLLSFIFMMIILFSPILVVFFTFKVVKSVFKADYNE